MSLSVKKLKEIANIRAGYPFRGKIKEVQGGGARVIQMRDADPEDGVRWSGLIATDLPGKRQPDWLKPGDLLFVTRGYRHFALHLAEVPIPTVLSPHFFHLTVRENTEVLSGFLAWQMNQEPAQHYFRKSAEGTQVLNIRRQVLEDLPIVVPSRQKQEIISRLNTAWRREQRVLKALADNRKRILSTLARQVLGVD